MTTTEESQSQPKLNSAYDYLFSLERLTSTKSRIESLRAWFSPTESVKLSFEECKRQMPLNLDRAAELRKLTTPLNLSLMEDDLAFAVTAASSEIDRLLRLSSIYTTIGFLSMFCFWLANQPKDYYLIILIWNLLVCLRTHLLIRWRHIPEKESLEYYQYLVKLGQL